METKHSPALSREDGSLRRPPLEECLLPLQGTLVLCHTLLAGLDQPSFPWF